MFDNQLIEDALSHLSRTDSSMNKLILEYPRPKLQKPLNEFEFLVKTIISQQLSLKAAQSLITKFNTLFGFNLSPNAMLDFNLENIGLSTAKIRTIRELSEALQTETLNFSQFPNMTDSEVIKALTKLWGIGNWTAHIFMIFGLGRINVFPEDDLGIKKALAINYQNPSYSKIKQIQKLWDPYRSIASYYLWQSLQNSLDV